MRLATVRLGDGSTRAARIDGDSWIDLGHPDLGSLLAEDDWDGTARGAAGPTDDLAGLSYAPVVPHPSKIVCVGLNYRTHILEMGRDLPAHPTLFAKFADTLIGATDPIRRPAETEEFDWECELAVVVGRTVRRAGPDAAAAAIAGFTVLNDITCRDWQFRTREWLQGKTWEATTPVGPQLVTPDELDGGVRPRLAIRTLVDGTVMQDDTTADLLFDPVDLIGYISTVTTLRPGDIIATGTPGGVGHARRPPVYLRPGQTVVTEIDGIGCLVNPVVADGPAQ